MKYFPLYFIVVLIIGSVSYVFYMHRNDTPIYDINDAISADSVLCKNNSDSTTINDSTLQIDENYNNRYGGNTKNVSVKHQEHLTGASAFYVSPQKNSKHNQDYLALNKKAAQKQQIKTKKTKKKKERTYSGRCQATTQQGWQCSRRAEPGRRFCWQHK
jgi:hypothetical protein